MNLRRGATLRLLLVLAAAGCAHARSGVPYGRYWSTDASTGDRWEIGLRDAIAFSRLDYGRERVHVLLTAQPINRERMANELGSGTGDPPPSFQPHGASVTLEICDFPPSKGMHLCEARISMPGYSGHLSKDPSPVRGLELAGGRIELQLTHDAAAPEGIDVTLDFPVQSLPLAAEATSEAPDLEPPPEAIGRFWYEQGSTGDRWELPLIDAVAYPPRDGRQGGSAALRLVVNDPADQPRAPYRGPGVGRIETPLEAFRTSFTLDLSFDAAVQDLRQTGKALRNDGGEPGATLAVLLGSPEPGGSAAMGYLSSLQKDAPGGIEVTGGRLYGDHAVLLYKGRSRLGDGGRLGLSRDGEGWKLDSLVECPRPITVP